MVPISIVFAVFIVRQIIIISANTHPICSKKTVNTGSKLHDLSLNRSCFAVDMTLNVDNILPDPSYISRDANLEVMTNALSKTLNDKEMTGFWITNNISMDRNWSIDDNKQCANNSDSVLNKFNFPTRSYKISCIDNTLNIDENMQMIECEFITPRSIVYIWNIESIELLINMSNMDECETANIFAIIHSKDILENEWKILGRSNILIINRINSKSIQQEFIFNQDMILDQDRIYSLIINITNCISPISVQLNPSIITHQEANPCKLGQELAINDVMKFGLNALCNINNRDNNIEDIIYQQHSSESIMNEYSYLYRSSLHGLLSNGTSYIIAGDRVFADYGQCIVFDDITKRIFAVGGEIDGAAIDRLKVYKFNNLANINIISLNLKLDKPRFGAMCFYYKCIENGREYIIVINGMNHINDINNDNNWYKDIVFIPLDPIENANVNKYNNFPKIKLKYNVIDMRPYISRTNILYLFGGRDGENAINYIQIIDLNEVFNAYNSESMIANNDIFTTINIMQSMPFNLVIPFSDFVRIHNKTCIMILGGEQYINNKWIDIDIPLNALQIYCNPIMNDQMNVPFEIIQFTQFDKENLQKIDNFKVENDVNNVFMTEYDFKNNNNILYEFSISLKICFNIDSGEYLMDTLNLFNNKELRDELNDKLIENMLIESRQKYKGWNYGFGKVSILNINTISTINDCIYQSLNASNCKRQILPNGDQKCGYNALNGDCYLIGRRNDINNNNFDDKQNDERNKYLQIVIDILCGIIFLLLLTLSGGVIYFRNKTKKEIIKKKNEINQRIEEIDVDHDMEIEGAINRNGPYDAVRCQVISVV